MGNHSWQLTIFLNYCLHLTKSRFSQCYKNIKTLLDKFGLQLYLEAFFITALVVVFPLT